MRIDRMITRIGTLGLLAVTVAACSSNDLSGSSSKATKPGDKKSVEQSDDPTKDTSKGTTGGTGGATKPTSGDTPFYAPINAATPLPSSYGTEFKSCTPSAADVTCDAATRTVTAKDATTADVVVTGPDGKPKTIHVIFFDPAHPPTDPAYAAQVAATGGTGAGTAGGTTGATTDASVAVTSDALSLLVSNNQDLNAISNWQQATPEGTHVVGGLPCPAGSATIFSVADCSSAHDTKVTCYGNLNFCAFQGPLTNDPNRLVTVDIQMTPEGTHKVGGIPCADGYAAIGGFADCHNAECFGNQLVCARQVPLSTLKVGDQIVTAFGATSENTHVVGGTACAAGQAAIGTAADCGLSSGDGVGCFGNPVFCVGTAPLK
jgi:hypothetical protein